MRIPRPLQRATALLFAFALVAPVTFAQPPAPAAAPAAGLPGAPLAEEAVTPETRPAKPRRAANPLYPRIAALLEAERTRVAELRARLAGTRDSEAAMAIQREVEQIRTETEIGVLRLQAEHARKQGRAAVADGIDAAIRQMTTPSVRPQAAARPAPVADVRATPTR